MVEDLPLPVVGEGRPLERTTSEKGGRGVAPGWSRTPMGWSRSSTERSAADTACWTMLLAWLSFFTGTYMA